MQTRSEMWPPSNGG